MVNSEPKKNGRVYENIDGISPMRERDAKKCDPLVNEMWSFDLDEPDLEVFAKLPKFLQKKITDNLEFAGSPLAKLLANSPAKDEEKGDDAGPAKADDDGDENPY